MQSSRTKNLSTDYTAKTTTPGGKGDLGMSYMTSSSFNDSAMMDVSAIHAKPIPKAPNDRVIHVSQCKNEKCPL